ncbi:MAG: hypothetical protein KatS3mg108_0319 [Isosphaeraceae bacterium]|nr:MAG: hypothetical protein KatS3mg108_0319 [Isosphaeraceae bacterium]
MVASAGVGAGGAGDLADFGGAAELADGQDQGFVEEAAGVEVVEESGEAAVEHGEDGLFEQGEVLAVGVPGLVEASAGADGDDADAGFDEAASQEEALAEVGQTAELTGLAGAGVVGVEAVAEADRVGFLGEVEGAACGGAGDQVEGSAVVFAEVSDLGGGGAVEGVVDEVEEGAAGVEACGREAVGEREAWYAVVGAAGVAGEEGVELSAEEAGVLAGEE